ncbi:hypothetical protein PF010_g26198 [Phytophthora fragariae]|uniref:Uncharacterized protein n=1 Tax=Phytophthora fragariae TaxID=53985 RepID=A0A6G0JXI0_9STRA|nr:hypothetical protein PF010_g26198 [Phytophthora fragariae]
MEAGTWATEGAGNTPAPSLGTGRVRTPNAGVYCTVEADCSVEVTSGVAALSPAAAANCNSAAGIGVSGAEAPDTARSVLVAAGSVRDVPVAPDVALMLLGPEVVAVVLLEAAESALDVVGTLVEPPMPADVTPESLMPPCAVPEAVVDEADVARAAGVPCSVGACPSSPAEEAESCSAAMTLSDMCLGTARTNCECGCSLGCEAAEC